MRTWKLIFTAGLLISLSTVAQQTPLPQNTSAASATTSSPTQTSAQAAPTTLDQVVDRALDREKALIKMLEERTPLIETYLQNLKPDSLLGSVPMQDHYFMGRLDLREEKGGPNRRDYLDTDKSLQAKLLGGVKGGVNKFLKFEYNPTGFSWMVFADRGAFDREHYDFHYARREFLGDIRTIVFDVTPHKKSDRGRFQGRIWVEDQDFNIVRMNGNYLPSLRTTVLFHMDSWRLNLIPGYWVPAFIYSEEGDFSYGSRDKIAFKAQTRIWGYNLKNSDKEDELTQVLVDSTVKDESAAAADTSPLQAQREWQQQAEDNVVERLQAAGLVAPPGEVDKVLTTVVNNLIVTNNLSLPRPVHTRVMLTSPLETFSVGNTIVVSRGLVDVLPDEASLAMVLSHELAHIVLGHNLGSKYAFNDRMLFSDESTYSNMGFRHIPDEEVTADIKAVEILKKSPYADKLQTAGLFLRQLQVRGPALGALLAAHLGNGFTNRDGQVIRLASLMKDAPELEVEKLDQIAALPLGGRVKVNPWDNVAELIKTAPVAITSARDKMPLEVTPFFPRLTRLNSSTTTPTTASNVAPPSK
jgi:hypothetical protein